MDVAGHSGVRFTHRHGGFGKKYFVETSGAGACFFDYDNDGAPDLYLVQSGTLPGRPGFGGPSNRSVLYRNDGKGRFTDVTDRAGVGNYRYGQGACAGDYDNDGDLDLYLVQSQMLGKGKTVKDALFPPKSPLTDRLYRNDLIVGPDGKRTLRFTDVTEQAGINIATYGMGVAAADIDNDGFIDIYRTGLTESVMLRNNRNGTFSDVTAKSGTMNKGGWGVSSSFVDIDRDGWLDLFVGNYVEWTPQTDQHCSLDGKNKSYCTPQTYKGQSPTLYRNRGNGTFENVTERAGLNDPAGKTLGVALLDYDDDGWIDLFVANDTEPNKLYRNNRNGTFTDNAVVAGVAFSEDRHCTRRHGC